MFNLSNYLLMEVAHQSIVKNVDVREDNYHMGYEPQSELELISPEEYSRERLVGILCGKAALHPFNKGKLVAVKLKFLGYKENDEFVNRIIIDDIKLVTELDHLYL